MDASTVVSLIGAVGIGSIITKYVEGGSDRRTARAKALAALSDVESERWVDGSTVEGAFVAAVRECATAGLVARVPRSATSEYLIYARAAFWLSRAAWERDPDPEFGGGIDAHFSLVVREAARLLADIIYAPSWRRRSLARRYSTTLSNHLDMADADKESKRQLTSSRQFGAVA